MKISLIVPLHNEEENVADLINKIEQTLDFSYELLVVNDHSIDRTRLLVEELICKYKNIRLVNNKLDGGFGNALRTGFKEAYGEVVVPIMGDLCDDLETVKKMLNKIEDGYDIVCGSRYIKNGKRQGGSILKGFLSCWGGRLLHFLLVVPTNDISNAFKMYRKSVLDSIDIKASGFEISMEIPLKAFYKGFKITEVPTVWKERTKGKSSFKVFNLLPNYIKLFSWAIFKRMGF